MTTGDEIVHRRVLNSVAYMIPELTLDVTPPEIAQQVYRVVYEITKESVVNGYRFCNKKQHLDKALYILKNDR